ncbi:MAG: AAA domain-containing protein [Treponemataceae bacterium]
MNLSDINVQDSLQINFKILYNKKIERDSIGVLIPDGKNYLFNEFALELQNEADRDELNFYLRRGVENICEVQASIDDTCSILCSFFNNEFFNVDVLNICIDPSKRELRHEPLGKWDKLPEKFYLKSKFKNSENKDIEETYFVVEGNPDPIIEESKNKKIKDDKNEKAEESETVTPVDDKEKTEQEEPSLYEKIQEEKKRTAFALINANMRIDVEEMNLGNKDEKYYSVRRVTKIRNRSPKSNYKIVKGKLEFSSERVAISEFTKSKLSKLELGQSYLKAWDKYAEERGERLLKLARKFGVYRIESVDNLGNEEYKIKVNKNLSDIKIESVDIVETSPLFIEEEELSWNDYIIKKTEKKSNDKTKNEQKDSIYNLEVVEKYDNYLIVKSEIDLKDYSRKLVVLSILGEEIQVERQTQARTRIAEGKSGIPDLGMLIEGEGNATRRHKERSLDLSYKVCKKIFTHEPTPKQREAIKIALQTPDIALIQGPPGTGKTTVICAIIEELNNMQNKNKNISSKVLVSSYQHDAVQNVINRLRINNLPTPKFGKKKDKETYNKHIDEWTEKIIKNLKEKNPNICLSNDEISLQARFQQYKSVPSEKNKRIFLKAMSEIFCLPSSLRNRIEKLIKKDSIIYDKEEFDKKNILKLIRALRISPSAYADDGKENCKKLLETLEYTDIIGNDVEKKLEHIIPVLEKLSTSNSEHKIDDLKNLAKIKKELLLYFLPRPEYIKPQLDENVLDIYEQVKHEIRISQNSFNQTERYQYEFLEQLESNRVAVLRSIQEYSYSISATAQQSVGSEITKFKKSSDDPLYFLYDTVIIDEAARATPPDLLIPMCNAQRRIILVGDHRQLPHLIDEEIENAITKKETPKVEGAENAINTKEYFNLSMFEYMFKRLKELENEDDIKRTITLDAQYRMHPILGNFASKQFYEKYGEAFESPRLASDFAHSLPYIENKPCVWIDVPRSRGEEKREGTSWIRTEEAKEIVKYIKEFSKNKDINFGVISFYKKQAEEISKRLEKEKLDHLVRVGTVDSFQGMEFDVVFLSAVRCNKKNNYGFLTMKNRLCVAMTRQKKVLIVVGDAEFLTSKKARLENNIPEIAAFYDLCKEKGKIL